MIRQGQSITHDITEIILLVRHQDLWLCAHTNSFDCLHIQYSVQQVWNLQNYQNNRAVDSKRKKKSTERIYILEVVYDATMEGRWEMLSLILLFG